VDFTFKGTTPQTAYNSDCFINSNHFKNRSTSSA